MRYFRFALWGIAIIGLMFAGAEFKEDLQLNAKIISKVPTDQKVVALTFDDGPSSKTTPEILAILKEEKIKATFFVVGENVEKLPSIVAQEVKDGHEIGIHTYGHKNLPRLSPHRVKEEMEKSEKVITVITSKPTLFRPPGGAYNKTVLRIARDMGYTVVLWSVDPLDWKCPPARSIVNYVVKNVKPGGIILLHDLRYPSPTIGAIRTIIDRLKAQGYQFVTVTELLQYYQGRNLI
ncbi:polysaccharide deacetylase [Lucifera butyrica]|uniref:Polysaccharide deacetylase n=1 Tax=Lucifera butyrica TaxID=1351585 RepID=A0A498R372_9FIRM|nr:polysaccharide deacetylase family protein [Lucifera butyrica]VBB05277.1 polysaccharide deacetylase [Lucifera butyrica]